MDNAGDDVIQFDNASNVHDGKTHASTPKNGRLDLQTPKSGHTWEKWEKFVILK